MAYEEKMSLSASLCMAYEEKMRLSASMYMAYEERIGSLLDEDVIH